MLSEKIYSIALLADEAVLNLLLILSIMNVAVILERFFYIRKFWKSSEVVRAKIKLALENNAINELENIAKETDSLEGKAARYALEYMKSHGSKGLEEFFNTFVQTHKPEMENRLGFLATVGSNAPFIGLLGTVFGIMKVFRELSLVTEQGSNQVVIMSGISMALVATGAGLLVAIPAVVSFNFFNRKVRYIFENLDSLKEMTIAYSKQKGL